MLRNRSSNQSHPRPPVIDGPAQYAKADRRIRQDAIGWVFDAVGARPLLDLILTLPTIGGRREFPGGHH